MEYVYKDENIAIIRLVVGPLSTNSYIIYDRSSLEALLVDPGGDYDKIINVIRRLGIKIRYVIATHGHFDHVLAAPRILDYTKALFAIHKDDEQILEHAGIYCRLYDNSWRLPRIDEYLTEDSVLEINDYKLRILHTPGHTPGSISILGKEFVLTGDTLFKGTTGTTRFPGGDPRALAQSITKLMKLPDNLLVLPGHGEYTTIGFERTYNPMVKRLLNGITRF
ncbi:MBL fold metallo-hydrolase [Desulfurococcaceae archaeon MEX13E-LK6-19]|nr:MBL fold metallo-hydrolase [Desulfurococcaceae archaeon MEX13E-LK6-19]